MVRAFINSIRINETTQQRIVILQDEAGQHTLPIWVGKPEARVLAMGLFKLDSPRPMSIHLLINLLKAAKMEIEEVHIEALKEEIFYATVKIRNGNNTFELDARPSDALTLAVYLDAPIYIAEEVMKQTARRCQKDRRCMHLQMTPSIAKSSYAIWQKKIRPPWPKWSTGKT